MTQPVAGAADNWDDLSDPGQSRLERGRPTIVDALFFLLLAAGAGFALMRYSQAMDSYEKAIQTGFREVADSLAARSGLAERIAATESLVAAQQKRTDLAAARYNKGVDSYFEVLTASLDLFTARQRLIQLRLARAINSVNLYKALGGGW